MDVARRLYLYVIAGITLALLVGALIELVNLALEIVLGYRDEFFGVDRQDYVRGRLSLVLATIGVALPVWAVHWGLAERFVRSDAARTGVERASALRALFLTLVLLTLFGTLMISGTQLLRYLLGASLGATGERSIVAASALGSLLIAGGFWVYHAAVRLRDLHSPMEGAAAWLPRTYIYLAAFIGLSTLLFGMSRLIVLAGAAIEAAGSGVFASVGVRPSALAETVAMVIVGGVAWAAHWWYSNRLVLASDWRGMSERGARTRYAYFGLVILIGIGGAIVQFAGVLRQVLLLATGSLPGVDAGDLVRDLGGMVALGLVFVLVWWSHRRSMLSETALLAPAQAVSAKRLDGYLVALIGLAAGSAGLAWLIGLALDVVLRGQRTLIQTVDWRTELATFLGFAVVGVFVWLWQIQLIERWRSQQPVDEARSTARRSYLLLAIAGSLIAGISSLVLLLNRLISALLGVVAERSLASELSAPAGVLTIALAVGVLHFLWLRRDQRVAAIPLAEVSPAEEGPAEEVPAEQAVPLAVATVERRLVLTAPADADFSATIATLRAGLPDGYKLDEAG